jgi:hypothetical protein
LTGDEADRHDLELLRRVEQPHARPLSGGLIFEGDLPEPYEGVSDVTGIVNGQPAPPAGIDVCERTVWEVCSLLRVETGHATDDINGV